MFHIPLQFIIKCDVSEIVVSDYNLNKGENVNWKLANDDNISSYDIMTDDLLHTHSG